MSATLVDAPSYIEMDEKKKRLARDIDTISDDIRKKYRALKHGIREEEATLSKSYKPILEPLQSISQALVEKKRKTTNEKPTKKMKREEDVEEEEEEEEDSSSKIDVGTPMRTPRFLKTTTLAETSDDDDETDPSLNIEKMLATPEGRREARKYLLTQYDSESLANKYMRMIVSSERDRLMDYTYGVRHANGKWMIGDSLFEIETDDTILIDGKRRYKGTPGLYELVFMKHPNEKVYNDADLKAYKDILRTTNAHKHFYLASAQVNANRGVKYKRVISQLFPPKRTGHGHNTDRTYMVASRKKDKIDYVHWDDPNELVDRLRLLMASQRAGNGGHTNEIVSIVEELREADIIV